MKILFIGQKQNFKGYINDYMSDLLLHGLRELYGDNVVDYPGSWHLYKDEFKKKNFEKDKLWGKGFTLMNILDGFDSIDRNDLSLKIKKNYFDYIIYGSIRRNDDFLESALKLRQDTETKTIESHLTRIRKKLQSINSQVEIVSKENTVFLV